MELQRLKALRRQGICLKAEATRKKNEALREAEEKALEQRATNFTVHELVEAYLTEVIEDRIIDDPRKPELKKRVPGARKPKGQSETRRTLYGDAVKVLGEIPAREVTRKLVTDMIMSIVNRGANVQAGNVLRELTAAYDYAIGLGRFRYNANESTDFSAAPWTNLGTGIYAIYREQPTISVTPQSQNITYGNDDPTSYTASYNGFVNGDTDAAITGTATWSTALRVKTTSTSGRRNAGSYDVAYNSGLLSGLGYGFADATRSTNELTVQQLALTVTGLTADNKVYDATTTATLGGTAAVAALGSDDITLGGTAAGALDNKNVGDGKAITVSGVTLGGADAGNYTLIQQVGLRANITKAPLTVTAADLSRTYGAANPSLTSNITGFVNDETLVTAGVSGTAALSTTATATTGVGTAYIVAALGDLAAANYDFTFVDGKLTITPRPITVTAEGKTKLQGEADPVLTFLVEDMADNRGLVEGESITGDLAREPGESVGSYTIGQGKVDEQNNPNYSVAFIGAELAIDGVPTPEPTTEPFDRPIADAQQQLLSSDSPSSGFTSQSNPSQSLTPEGGQESGGQTGFTSGGITYVSLVESSGDSGDADEGGSDSVSQLDEGGQDGSGFIRVFVVNGGINFDDSDAVEDSGDDDDANLGQDARN